MTTKADWKFRRRYLNDAAKRLEDRAGDLMREAARYRELSLLAAKQIRRARR